MKSICIVITGLSTGGAEMMLLKLMQRIDRSRFQPTVISLTSLGEIGPRIEILGIPVHDLSMTPSAPNIIKFMRLVGLLRQLGPDVVHTWMYHADLVGGLASRFAGIKAVTWGIRQSNLSPDQSKRSTLLVMKVCARISGWLPRRILSCSERARSIHVAAGYHADKMVLIPNGFDLSRFQPNAAARYAVRAELGLEPDTPIVGMVARDDPQKNHPGFIVAAAKVHAALPLVHFVLAGTGIDRNNKALIELIEKANLGKQVHLLGRRDDVPRLMASIDVLASSSSFGEAFPNVLGEAMASGVPCVVTDVGDSAEIVGDTGRVVASGDMNGLALHLVELLRWPANRRSQLGLLARQRVADRYEIGEIVLRYEAFYTQLMRGG
ncbi:MAG: glycosyltransferase [Hydrogenophaga sp.]|uniref:glycosyltransferase family 4 protein n=1 Tax=Hydrogenophaga sp. TaxID=1904254 RepID=UPI0025BE3F7C|nr:glycosyltransferase [Hydrogenophaga sp.]MBT9550649.1 glycosyltransferase [Hydrogenophaga sp.]